MEVHKLLGPGFLEGVYEQALTHELKLRKIPFTRQMPITVRYKAVLVGDYNADIVVDNKIIIELKAVTALAPPMSHRHTIISSQRGYVWHYC